MTNVQFAVAAGGRAVITSSSDDKLEKVVDHLKNSYRSGGAGELVTVNYKNNPEWSKKVWEVTEEGADHILEVREISEPSFSADEYQVGGAGTVEQCESSYFNVFIFKQPY